VNTTEARAVQTLLRFVLNGSQGRTADGVGGVPANEAATAALLLAARSSHQLGTGWTATTLNLAWPGNRVHLAEALNEQIAWAEWLEILPPAELQWARGAGKDRAEPPADSRPHNGGRVNEGGER
jgi:hypothetical protein